MHSVSSIKQQMLLARAFLYEIDMEGPQKQKLDRAHIAKSYLEEANKRLNTVIKASHGFTEGNKTIEELIILYDLLNKQCLAIIPPVNGLERYKGLFRRLDKAEKLKRKAENRIIFPKEALNSINAVELTIQQHEAIGDMIPDSIKDRLKDLRGYMANI